MERMFSIVINRLTDTDNIDIMFVDGEVYYIKKLVTDKDIVEAFSEINKMIDNQK